MDRLAQIAKEVAKMRKTEQALKPVRDRATQIRAEHEASLVRQQAAQKPKRLLFAALFDAPAPEKKPQAKPMSKSAKRRLKIQQQFAALCEVQDVFVSRKHR